MNKIFNPIIAVALLLAGCSDNLNISVPIQPDGDKIMVETAVFSLATSNVPVEYIYSKPDSFLLGNFADPVYGTLQADVLTQLQPPVDFKFPAGAVADSAKLQLYYINSWIGSKYDPMQISVYRMNKGTFKYPEIYRSNIDANDYCDRSEKIGEQILSARDAAELQADDSTMIEIPLTQDFVRYFSPVLKTVYALNSSSYQNTDPAYTVKPESDFHNFFNGLYVTTDFGSASMLYIRYMRIKYWFHYTYPLKSSTGADSAYVTTAQSADFPVTGEVRMVNRFVRPDRQATEEKLNAASDVNYVVSPASMFTEINLSFDSLRSKLNTNGKKLLINRASLEVNLNTFNTESLNVPVASSLMLIKKSAYDRFFKGQELPSDTCAIIADVNNKTVGDSIQWYYKYDLAKLITNELNKPDNGQKTLSFQLLPVSFNKNTGGAVIELKAQNRMTATKIYSGSHPTMPMKLEMVYSGF